MVKEGKKEFKEDLLNRGEFADILVNYIKEQDSAVLALNAPWGEGKTFFIKEILYKSLEEDEIPCFYLDAFKCDYINDPFNAIVDSLILNFNELEIETKDLESFWEKTKKAGALFKNKLRAGIPDIAADIGDMVGLGNTLKAVVESGIAAENELCRKKSPVITLKEWIKAKNEEKELLEDIKTALNNITNNLKKPLIFFIDELDRCRPNFAVELLEKIKHIFSVENIIFVLAVNPNQMYSSIRHIYGRDINAPEYLHKFFDLQFSLPYSYNHTNYDPSKFIEWKVKENLSEFEDLRFLNCVAKASKASLRDIEKVFNVLPIIKSNNSNLTNDYILIMLTFAKVTNVEAIDINGISSGIVFDNYKEGCSKQDFVFSSVSEIQLFIENISSNCSTLKNNLERFKQAKDKSKFERNLKLLNFLESLNSTNGNCSVRYGIKIYAQAIDSVFNYITPESEMNSPDSGM